MGLLLGGTLEWSKDMTKPVTKGDFSRDFSRECWGRSPRQRSGGPPPWFARVCLCLPVCHKLRKNAKYYVSLTAQKSTTALPACFPLTWLLLLAFPRREAAFRGALCVLGSPALGLDPALTRTSVTQRARARELASRTGLLHDGGVSMALCHALTSYRKGFEKLTQPQLEQLTPASAGAVLRLALL